MVSRGEAGVVNRERYRDRQTDRQTVRQTDRDRQTETERHREKDKETDRRTARETQRSLLPFLLPPLRNQLTLCILIAVLELTRHYDINKMLFIVMVLASCLWNPSKRQERFHVVKLRIQYK